MNIKNKKILAVAFISIIIILIGICLIIYSYESETEESLSDIVSSKITAYETDIIDSLDSLSSNEDIANFLSSWGKAKNLSVTSDYSGNVIYSIKAASPENKTDNPTLIVCTYDINSFKENLYPIITALTVAKNPKNNGQFKIIFTPKDKDGNTQIHKLNSKIFSDNPNVFCLDSLPTSRVSINTGGYREYLFYDEIKYVKSTYDKAYKIKIKNMPKYELNSSITTISNPIKTLGGVLANFKSTSLLFELASFNGGSSPDTTAKSVSMTILIKSQDEEKFIKKITNSIDKFYEKYSEDYPEIEYTYEEVKTPKKVFSKEDTEDIISLLYTSPSGAINKDDEGTIISLANLGRVSTKDGNLEVNLSACSYDDEELLQIDEMFQNICGLSKCNFKLVKNKAAFNGGEASNALLTTFEECFLSFTNDKSLKVFDTAEYTIINDITDKEKNLSAMYCVVTEKTMDKFAGSLITFLDTSVKFKTNN